VVATYLPQGNWDGEYEENVLPPIGGNGKWRKHLLVLKRLYFSSLISHLFFEHYIDSISIILINPFICTEIPVSSVAVKTESGGSISEKRFQRIHAKHGEKCSTFGSERMCILL
jgi:hypothetical protein